MAGGGSRRAPEVPGRRRRDDVLEADLREHRHRDASVAAGAAVELDVEALEGESIAVGEEIALASVTR